MNFPGGSDGKESTRNVGNLGSIPGPGKIPGRRKRQPSPVSCLEKSYGWRSLVGYRPWSHKESDTTERLTHSVLGAFVSFTCLLHLSRTLFFFACLGNVSSWPVTPHLLYYNQDWSRPSTAVLSLGCARITEGAWTYWHLAPSLRTLTSLIWIIIDLQLKNEGFSKLPRRFFFFLIYLFGSTGS